jgi:hypothetical protein
MQFGEEMSGEMVPGGSMGATGGRKREKLEARGGIEPPIMVLQTIALPLGDRAFGGKVVSLQSSVLS